MVRILLPFAAGWAVLFPLVSALAASIPTLLASYHVFLRFTWIGAILNGRRHPIKRRPTPGTAGEPGWQK